MQVWLRNCCNKICNFTFAIICTRTADHTTSRIKNSLDCLKCSIIIENSKNTQFFMNSQLWIVINLLRLIFWKDTRVYQCTYWKLHIYIMPGVPKLLSIVTHFLETEFINDPLHPRHIEFFQRYLITFKMHSMMDCI